MNNHSIFVCRSTYIDSSVSTFSVVDIKTVFPYCGSPLREGYRGRSGPLHCRGGVSKEVTPQYCLFAQITNHLSWRRFREPWRTCIIEIEIEMSHECGILADWRERLISMGAANSDSICNQNAITN